MIDHYLTALCKGSRTYLPLTRHWRGQTCEYGHGVNQEVRKRTRQVPGNSPVPPGGAGWGDGRVLPDTGSPWPSAAAPKPSHTTRLWEHSSSTLLQNWPWQLKSPSFHSPGAMNMSFLRGNLEVRLVRTPWWQSLVLVNSQVLVGKLDMARTKSREESVWCE